MISRMERFSVSDQSALMKRLRELEGKLPRVPTPTGGQVGPQGAMLQISINAQVPFKEILKNLAPEVLYKMLDELRDELSRRGLKE